MGEQMNTPPFQLWSETPPVTSLLLVRDCWYSVSNSSVNLLVTGPAYLLRVCLDSQHFQVLILISHLFGIHHSPHCMIH